MTYVMSDIHGHIARFDSVMRQIQLQPEDTLYILGDIIDRNADGLRILQRIMKMPNVVMLLGNHEQMMLNAVDAETCTDAVQTSALDLWYRNGGECTHRYWKRLRKTRRSEILAFLHALPIEIELDIEDKRYLLAHAAPMVLFKEYRLRTGRYKTKEHFALWHRFNTADWVPNGRKLIFGHTPTRHYQDNDPLCIWPSKKAIGIDCGCAYDAGRLACLRLDDMMVFYSED